MLNLVAAAATRIVAAGGSITSPNSVLNESYRYTHRQALYGSILNGIICTALMLGLAVIAWQNWGPPARRKLAAAGADNATTLRAEGLLLGLEPWVWSIITCAFTAAVVLSSVLYYS